MCLKHHKKFQTEQNKFTHDKIPLLVHKTSHWETNETHTLPAPTAQGFCHRGGEPGKDDLRSSRGKKKKKTTWDLQESTHTVSTSICTSAHTAILLGKGCNDCIFFGRGTVTYLNVMFVLNDEGSHQASVHMGPMFQEIKVNARALSLFCVKKQCSRDISARIQLFISAL